jgi:L-threonylcarbamoyladenylate synthase
MAVADDGQPDAVARAADALRRGRLVVFPTETVYGVGAHALDSAAVAKVFAAKGRPPDNPLIVHVADAVSARALVRTWPEPAQRLADAFWPGPLTLVLPRAASVPDVTTGGLDSVAVRVPDHALAQALLRAAKVPVAAPSANRSGRPSPTRIEDARADLGDAVDVYLDGGPCRIGVESTVIALLDGPPRLLRPGGLARGTIERILGPLAEPEAGKRVPSPGARHPHYAPRARVRLVDPASVAEARRQWRSTGARVAVVASREAQTPGPDVFVLGGRDEPEAWAH